MVVHSQGESQPPIATIVSYGLSSFEALLSALDGTLPERSAAVSHLARFRLWAGSLGAHRPSGSRSLAYRLRDASTIKNHIISLLQGLCESVDEGVLTAKETSGGVLVLAAQQNVGAEVGDSTDVALKDYFRDDADGRSEISRILDDVGHIVDCLLRLSITIRNPAPHDHFKSRVGADLVGLYEQWDIKHIREKFPNALPGLAERLGKATARRRQYFKYREEHVGKLAEGLDAAEVVEGDGGDKATTNASSIPNYLKGSHATDNFAESDAESNISRTSYAPSTASETQLRVPPLPKEYSDGPFQCPYCRMIVSMNTRHDWKKHVFRDLRPYVCLSSSCTMPEQQHLRRSDWIEHMKRHHWRTWRCPYGSLCDDFRSARDFEEHVKGKHSSHGPLSFLDALQSLSSHTDLARAKGNCPLCSDFHIMSAKQYISHVAAHLEQLALFGLPSTDAEGEESDDIGSKSNGQGGDWKGYNAESLSSMDSNYIARRERRHPSHIDTEEAGEDEGEYTAEDFRTINDLALDELNTPQRQRQEDSPANVLPEAPIPQPAMPTNQGSGHSVSQDPAAKPLAPVPSPPPPKPPNPRVPSPQSDPGHLPSHTTPGDSTPKGDTLLLRLDGITYPEHFPAHSIHDGKLLVSDVAERISIITDFTGMVNLIYNGQPLGNDSVPIRDYGVRNNSELLVRLGKPPLDVGSDSYIQEAAQGQGQESVHGWHSSWQRGVDDTSPSSPFVQPDLATDSTFEPVWPGPSSSPRLPSSYWSVSEVEAFPGLLRTFGTDWAKIADYMQTKTATMVKNFYARNITARNKPEWELFAMRADAQNQRQEKQPEHAPPPDGPLEQINKISARFKTEMRHLCEEFIANPPGTTSEAGKMHRALSERVMQNVLLPLDGVDTAGEHDARQARRDAVKEVQDVLRRMDAVFRSKKAHPKER